MWQFGSSLLQKYEATCTSNISHTSISTCHRVRKCFWLGQNRFLSLGENKWTSPAHKIRVVWTSIHLKNISRGKRMQIMSEVIWKIMSLKGNKKTFPSSSLLHRPLNKQTHTQTEPNKIIGKPNPLAGQIENIENYRRVPKQRLEPCSSGLTMVN